MPFKISTQKKDHGTFGAFRSSALPPSLLSSTLLLFFLFSLSLAHFVRSSLCPLSILPVYSPPLPPWTAHFVRRFARSPACPSSPSSMPRSLGLQFAQPARLLCPCSPVDMLVLPVLALFTHAHFVPWVCPSHQSSLLVLIFISVCPARPAPMLSLYS